MAQPDDYVLNATEAVTHPFTAVTKYNKPGQRTKIFFVQIFVFGQLNSLYYRCYSDYDLLLLKTSEKIRFSPEKISPACLPNPDIPYNKVIIRCITYPLYKYCIFKMCWFAGWGKLRTRGFGPYFPDELQETEMTVNTYCGKYDRLLTKSSFCAGFLGHSAGCSGDSGGPLICQDIDGTFAVHGVASWASRTCSPRSPTGFATLRGQFILE